MTTRSKDRAIKLPDDVTAEDQCHLRLDGRTGALMVTCASEGNPFDDVVMNMDIYAPPTVFAMLAKLADGNQADGRGMTEEQRVHAGFWSGYFYAEAMAR